MWVVRTAITWSVVGLALLVFVLHRNESMESLIEYAKEAEVWVAAGFLLLLAFFLYLRVPRTVGKMLDERANAISKELEEAKRLREEAAAVLAGYVEKAALAETEAARIVADAKEEAERFAKETRVQLRQQIERRAQIAREKIEQAEAAALGEIRALAADKAAAAAETLIVQHLDAPRADALVSQSIQDFTANTP